MSEAAATATGARGGRALALRRLRVRWAWIFLAPTLAVAAVVAGWPLFRTLTFAFTDTWLFDLDGGAWVGFANFAAVLGDPIWWRTVWNTAVFTVASVALELVLGLVFALLLDVPIRGRRGMRAAILIPWVIPTVVSAQMFAWMFHDVFGVVNDMLLGLGIIEEPVAWLADSTTAMAAVVLTDVWKTTPFMTLILFAGLQSIPSDVYEAARVDGIGRVRTFLFVTLPLLKPAIAVGLVFRTVAALRVFDQIYVMTSNSVATASVSVYARQQMIDFQDVGYGSAVSVLIFLLVAAFTAAVITTLRFDVGEAR